MTEEPTILIVEDEMIIARDTQRKLHLMGYRAPDIVSSGEAAIEKAEALHPDLVLMDIILKGEMDGVEAADQIRTRFDIPVVYVTANVSDSRLDDITRSEPFGCLFKPFEDLELHAAVKMALYRHKIARRLRESETKLHKEMVFSNTLIQASPAFFVAIDGEGTTIMMNESMLQALGYTSEEVAGKDYLTSFVPERDRERLSRVFKKLTDLHEPSMNENHVLPKDGRELLVEWHGRSVFDAQGAFEYFFGTGIDITERKEAEKTLRERDLMFRLITDNMKDLVFMIDLNGEIQYSTPSLKDILGYTPEERVGKSSFDIVHPEDIEHVTAIFVNAIATSTPAKVEYRVRHADGHYVWVEALGNLLFDDDVKAVGAILNIRDITERRQAEELLRTSDERFRTILESPVEGYFEVDLAGRFTFFNEAMRKVSGFPADELMGMSYLDYTDSLTAEKCYRVFHEIYETGKPGEIENFKGRAKDGSTLVFGLSASLMRNRQGEPVGFRVISRDITEQKKMEELLAESEERYRSLVENMREIIYSIDATGIVTYVSPSVEQIGGYTPDEIMGKSLIEFIHPDDLPRVAQRFQEIITSGDTRTTEYRILTKSGNTVWVRTHARLRHEKDRVTGLQGVLADVTDLKKAEEEIRTHQDHLALINKILRHDLTNDLTVIRSAINLYKESPDEELLGAISSHAEKSLDLITGMRELESFISRHRELQMCEIGDAVDDVIKNYPSTDFEVTGSVPVMADDSLVSVIDNIVRNAVVHGKADMITITTVKEGNISTLRIADNGSGIPNDIKEKIFEEGFIYGDRGHTGIGLHIVKKAMESYGGEVFVEDNTPRGAAFVLRFVTL